MVSVVTDPEVLTRLKDRDESERCVRRLAVAEHHRMIEAGIFGSDEIREGRPVSI